MIFSTSDFMKMSLTNLVFVSFRGFLFLFFGLGGGGVFIVMEPMLCSNIVLGAYYVCAIEEYGASESIFRVANGWPIGSN